MSEVKVRPTAWRVDAECPWEVRADRAGVVGVAFIAALRGRVLGPDMTPDEVDALADALRAAATVVRGDAEPARTMSEGGRRLRALAEVREALGAGEDEKAVDAARRVAADRDGLAKGIAAAKQLLDAANAERDALRIELAKLCGELAAVSQAVTERRSGETLAQAVTRARVERDAAVCEVSRLRAEAADAHKKMQAKIDSLREASHGECDRQAGIAAKLRGELADATQEVKRARQAVAQAEADAAEARADAEGRGNAVQALKAQLAQADAALRQLGAQP